MVVKSDNPLVEAIRERRIERPDSLLPPRDHTFRKRPKITTANPVALAVSKLATMLCQYGHSWNKGEKLLYRRAILSVKHPCCPTCGKPMNESAVTTEDGKVHKSWYCEMDANLGPPCD